MAGTQTSTLCPAWDRLRFFLARHLLLSMLEAGPLTPTPSAALGRMSCPSVCCTSLGSRYSSTLSLWGLPRTGMGSRLCVGNCCGLRASENSMGFHAFPMFSSFKPELAHLVCRNSSRVYSRSYSSLSYHRLEERKKQDRRLLHFILQERHLHINSLSLLLPQRHYCSPVINNHCRLSTNLSPHPATVITCNLYQQYQHVGNSSGNF